MKKILSFMILVGLVTGCSCTADITASTPTKEVEKFFNNYQTLHNDVIAQLEDVVENEMTFTDEQKEKYKGIMKKHYQDLTYEIKDETINGDSATVQVEIEVRDYSKAMQDANNYLIQNPEEFNDETGNYSESLFNEYRLEKIKEVEEKVKYNLNLRLTKVDDKWALDDISEIDESKIHGTYKY